MAPARVFIGSDERGGRGEIVLEHGIKRYSPDAQVVHMRPGGEGGHWEHGDWNMGRTHARPYSGEGWATNFTCYRWSIPEAAGFEGRAVYLDADQTVHADIRGLQECDLNGQPCAIRKGVIVFHCAHPFWRSSFWPKISNAQRSGWGLGHYMEILKRHGGGSALFGVEWDVLDGKEMSVWQAKLNHYTDMRTQPYHPFPDRFRYPERHPKPEVDQVWWEAYRDALCERFNLEYPGYRKFTNLVQWCIVQEAAAGLNCFGRPEGFEYHFTNWETLEAEVRTMNPHFRGLFTRPSTPE